MNKVISFAIIVLVAVLVLGAAAAVVLPLVFRTPLAYGYRGMMGPYMMGGYGLVGTFVTFLFVLLIVLAVLSLVSPAGRPAAGEAIPPSAESPIEILQRRYAKGEITKEQYEEIKREISL